jgi:hypothetical protein
MYLSEQLSLKREKMKNQENWILLFFRLVSDRTQIKSWKNGVLRYVYLTEIIHSAAVLI